MPFATFLKQVACKNFFMVLLFIFPLYGVLKVHLTCSATLSIELLTMLSMLTPFTGTSNRKGTLWKYQLINQKLKGNKP